MHASRMNLVTLREDPSDAEIASHRLLTRAGYLHKSGAGLYLYGPLLQRVLDKIGRIVASEIAAVGGLQITMPILQERALWLKSGRWPLYLASRTMLTVTDRSEQVFGLAPTAEEVVTDYAASVVKSYKQLPVTFFQQHTKFRDEIRPRFGLMRVKEFIMMDAYSFHDGQASLDATYEDMRQAYHRIFRRLGLEAFAVEADSGAIGGSGSHEFMVAAEVGEDTILFSSASGYAANRERATGTIPARPPWLGPAEAVLLATPGVGSIEAVTAFLQQHGHPEVGPAHLIKTLLVVATAQGRTFTCAACVRGDREVNEVKLINALTRWAGSEGPVLAVRPMTPEEIRYATGAGPGFAGPGRGLTVDVCLIDAQLDVAQTWVVGANRDDAHLVGFRLDRDTIAPARREDLITMRAGDACPLSGTSMQEKRGIEIGHVFKLGTKYSAAMHAEFTGQDGQLHPFIMGCYGIGTSRIAAAAVEQHHDANGICWPVAIAPYQCVVVPVGKPDDRAVAEAAQRIYADLLREGVEAVLDDRDLKPGVKFKDWDLIGIPFRIVVGRGVASGLVEFKPRTAPSADVPLAEVVRQVVDAVRMPDDVPRLSGSISPS